MLALLLLALRPLTVLIVLAGAIASPGWTHGRAVAAPTGDNAFHEVVSLPLTITDDRDAVVWRVTTLPTVTDATSAVPFSPGFLYASEDMLLIYRPDGQFSRLRSGNAIAIDGKESLAPVAYGGSPSSFLAIELAEGNGGLASDGAVGEQFDLPAGDWQLTLWAAELPAGTTAEISLDDAVSDDNSPTEPDSTLPDLMAVVRGTVDVVLDDADQDATTLTASTDAAAIVETGSLMVHLADDAAATDGATVLAVTLAPIDGSGAAATSTRGRGTGQRTDSGDSGSVTGGGANPASAEPSGDPSLVPSASPSATPRDLDTDGDELSDAEEVTLGTNPNMVDTDGDFLTDFDEVRNYETNPLLVDTDDDGLSDEDELDVYGTNPTVESTDGDQLSDGEEVNLSHTSPLLVDTDGDCIGDYYEYEGYFGSDPLVFDTDQDGVADGLDQEPGTFHQDEGTQEHCV